MFWMWSGAILLSLGGLLAACDKRYRLTRNRVVRPQRRPEAATARPQEVAG